MGLKSDVFRRARTVLNGQRLDYISLRRQSFSLFKGDGLDIGPFDEPFIPDSTARKLNLNIESVDRWSPDDLKALFPEISESTVKDPTYIHDVSAHGLGFAENDRYDFVVCSHVLEHLANPFWLIEEAYRVLKTGGVLYVSVPDGRYSDDEGRRLTEYEELLGLFEQGVKSISDEKVLDYLSAPRIRTGWVQEVMKNNAVTPEILENERRRSFHVHVWDSASFVEHFVCFSEHARFSWRLLDLLVFENNGYENVIIVKKSEAFSPKTFSQDTYQLAQRRAEESCGKAP